MRILKLVSLYIIPQLLLFSCDSPDEPIDPLEQFEKETELVDQYLQKEGLAALIEENSQIRYILTDIEDSLGKNPESAADTIVVNYQLQLLGDTTILDSGEGSVFTLRQVIPGFGLIMTKTKEGQNVEFFVPSFYGYGANPIPSSPPSFPGIPAYSTLHFKVDLLSVGKSGNAN